MITWYQVPGTGTYYGTFYLELEYTCPPKGIAVLKGYQIPGTRYIAIHRGESGTRPTRKETGSNVLLIVLLIDDLRVFRATEGSTESFPLVLGSRAGVMPHGGYVEWEAVSGSRRSGGMFRGEVAQGRGGEQLATPRSRGCQE